MLKKIMKYEWKNTAKLGRVLLLAILIVTVLGAIVLQTPMFYRLFDEANGMNVINLMTLMMGGFSFVFYVILLLGAMYGMLVFVGIHFFKTMYGSEGYLSNTLPVSSHNLLFGKVFVSGVWLLLMEAVAMMSGAVLLLSLGWGLVHGDNPDMSLWQFMREAVQAFVTLVKEGTFDGLHLGGWMTYIFAVAVISPFISVMNLFGSLTIGQLSRKYKLMVGILTYIGLMIAQSVIQSFVSSFGMANSLQKIYDGTMTSTIPFLGNSATNFMTSVAIAVIMYFVSHHIITNKLNLE
ncbi:MAG: hypothetical protein K6G30_12170 [Acetatifactor sp.]|nr:hypothetical protein [Acetatifactor sp.]